VECAVSSREKLGNSAVRRRVFTALVAPLPRKRTWSPLDNHHEAETFAVVSSFRYILFEVPLRSAVISADLPAALSRS
jgi:hypothetical protein